MNIENAVSQAMTSLALGEAFTFDELVQRLRSWRERPLRIVEISGLAEHDGMCAVWLMTERSDFVLHARSESRLHQQQFVLHELAHMILGHGEDTERDLPDLLLPDIPPSMRRRLLARQNLESEEEIAAEALADQLATAIRGSAVHESRFLEIFG